MAVARRSLTTGSVKTHLTRLTAPMILAVLAIMSVGLADAYFIGLIGKIELAAMGFVFPVITAITSLAIGLSAGANALVSQALGANRDDDARRLAAQILVTGFAVGLVMAVVGFNGFPALFGLLQAHAEVLPSITLYMRVWFLAFPVLVVMLVANALIRAHGNTLVPSLIMVANALFNIVLDPLLIFGAGPLPALGIAGAAWASMLSYFASFLAMNWALFRTFKIVHVSDFFHTGYTTTASKLAHLGLPAAMANALNPAGLAVVTAILARFGPSAVAGFGAAGRVETFVMVPLFALSGSIGPIIGQNWGAGHKQRAAQAVGYGTVFCLAYGLLIAVILNLAAPDVASLFSDDLDVQKAASVYLRLASWSFFAYGILIIVNAALNARSKPLSSMFLSIVRIAGLYIPLALAGAAIVNAPVGIYAGTLLANLVAAAAAIAMAYRLELFRLPFGALRRG